MNEVGVFKRTQQNTKEPITTILRLPLKTDFAPTVLMMLTARAGILGMFPFGTALFAAAYDKKIAYLGMIAASVGALSMGAGAMTIKYIFAMVMFWLYTRIYENHKKANIISSIVCGVSILISGIATFSFSGITGFDILLLVAESIITAGMYIVFDKSVNLIGTNRHKLSQEEIICFCITIAVVIMGFSKIIIPFGMEVTKILSAYTVMLLAMNTGLAAAGSGAVAMGLICGVNSDKVSALMGVYGICGIVANMLKSFGKYGVMIGFLSACALVMLCDGTSLNMPISVTEIIAASFIFVITPNSIHQKIDEFFAKNTSMTRYDTAERVKEYLSGKLKNTSEAFSNLADRFEIMSKRNFSNEDKTIIFDNTAERVCKGCGMATHCWKRGINGVYNNMVAMLEVIEEKGSISLADLPENFSENCIKSEKLINMFTHMYELHRERIMRMGEMAQSRGLIAEQYREISNIMQQFSEETVKGLDYMEEKELNIIEELDKLGIVVKNVNITSHNSENISVKLEFINEYDPNVVRDTVSKVLDTAMVIDYANSEKGFILVERCRSELDVGVVQISRVGEKDNGDSVISFTTDDHKYVVAISDGMGSGTRAMEESRLTTEMLKDFIKAGFDKVSGVNMINSSLALSSSRESFSTLDLLVIDKNEQTAEFIKAGAPESYILSGGDIDTVFAMSLPTGILTETDVDTQKRSIKKGDLIVMMSDGVSDAGKSLVRGEWIKKMMMSSDGKAQDLANNIINGALARSHSIANDDMSVAVIRIM